MSGTPRDPTAGASAKPLALDVVELGCGTACFSAWLAGRGAQVVGVDTTPAQPATARRCQLEFDLMFPLIQSPAEYIPLPDASFDLAVSEYGASTWPDPYLDSRGSSPITSGSPARFPEECDAPDAVQPGHRAC
jgi:ubiquinone/menaquinone biosynthesis C-methylase UbiE